MVQVGGLCEMGMCLTRGGVVGVGVSIGNRALY